ncbi:hypothetical protein QRX60_25980 [Amycolatopsis mongoliensis]|uniref:Uncharacterized protein n=1 Tax=Amycolatopsis mongoliensis TaxID=715475 RepID=A0A9Y2JYL0_9PSEU|nr:hypothetical protein [Amycolatopsis sp. 4-36]WIY07136.1 hypothetical protein QRX60_25980 [Amycolatopsis sp. 4-36]
MSEEDEAAGPRLAEEIRLLVEMVVEKAAPWLEGVVAAGHGAPDEAKPDASACGWCPLCAIVAVVRGERPEFAARLLEQLAQLVALLRAVLADRWEPDEGVHMPGFRPAPRPADSPASARVQHIAVRRRDEWRPDRES